LIKPFDIYITYITWGVNGKNRPVLVVITNNDSVDVYKITTKYDDKSESIRSQYFKINDWTQSGLEMQSYVDTGTLISLSKETFKSKSKIGELTINDKIRLLEFFNNLN